MPIAKTLVWYLSGPAAQAGDNRLEQLPRAERLGDVSIEAGRETALSEETGLAHERPLCDPGPRAGRALMATVRSSRVSVAL